MIEYVLDDLTNAPEPVIIHGCNAKGVMGSGVAKAIKEKWPEVYNTYRGVYLEHGLSLGQIIWVLTNDNKLIGNCITQLNYDRNGRYVNYSALRHIMSEVNSVCDTGDYREIAMPMIGCGLGGGDWESVLNIIEEHISYPTVKVYYL